MDAKVLSKKEMPPRRYRFGEFTLEPESFRLARGDAGVPLTPKAFELLVLLVRHRHRGLTKQELFDAVWPETAVTENTLTQRIKELREALGDTPQDPVYIRTIARVGYQFVGDVGEETAADPRAGDPQIRLKSEEAPVDLSAGQTAARRSPWGLLRRPPGMAIAGLIGVAVIGLFAYRGFVGGEPPSPVQAATGRVMLLVLPFENLSGNPEEEYFSDGLTEEMIAELGRLDPSRLGVIARTSSMAYKSTRKRADAIAKELGVDYILEGSVRREADRVRIVAQLIRASDETHVWAERYDRDLRNILSLQGEVARAIAAETRVRLSGSREARAGLPSTVHPEAYETYLKGRFFLNQRRDDAIRKAREFFERAIAIEPAYAQAYAGLADAHELSTEYSGVSPREGMPRAMEAARRALELGPDLSEPYTSLGIIHGSYTWDWTESERAFVRALELNANSALAHKGYGELLTFLGRHDEAIREVKQAVALDPVSLIMNSMLGVTYYRARQYDDAIAQMQKTLEVDPNYMLGHFNLGLALAGKGSYDAAIASFSRAHDIAPRSAGSLALLGYAQARAGKITDARRTARELSRRASEHYVTPYVRAVLHLGLGERQEALTALDQAYENRSWLVAMLKVDPALDPLRGDPRFESLVRRMKFPESTTTAGR